MRAHGTDVQASARFRRQSPEPGEVGDLPVPARRAEPDGPVRPQAGADEASRQAVSGQARDPLRQAGGQPARLAVSVSAARPVGHGAQRAGAAHARDRRRPDADPLDDDRVGRSRDGPAADPHRQDPGRPADLGLVGGLRPGHREPEPAGLRRPVRPRRPAGRRRPQLVERLAAGHLPGDAVPLGRRPVLNLETPPGVTRRGPRRPAPLPRRAEPRPPATRHPGNTELEARIANFEIAAAMQTAVPEALDLSRESDAHPADVRPGQSGDARIRHPLPDRPPPDRAGRPVRPALPERPALGHAQQERRDAQVALRRTDQPSAALVTDLKQRGLLDETIVLWTGEFGRLPVSQGTDGRDHNRHGFSLWLAGGGFKRGYVHGATDDFGYKSVENVVTVHDLQATLLHALGLDHRKLTYPHEGRLDSLTDAEVTKAKVIPDLLA